MDVQIVSRLRGIPVAPHFRKWLKVAIPASAELTLRVVNAAEGRRLNNTFRGKDYATNVLTFVYHEADAKTLLGDIVLCAPVVAREAREQGKLLDAHYAHMSVHGALHLAGMDHETARDAKIMEAREIGILKKLSFGNPYA
ncbi:MAG: rRNA maturation RNase YbeY [Betaproteobacteria bacterium]|nr:rRNA maturation RNase YbeY [Betaproteobacteria bacterium]